MTKTMEVFGDYTLQERLRKGSYAEAVWAGTHNVTGEKVALKCLDNDGVFAKSARIEIQSLVKLTHPNIVRYLGFEADEHYFWIITEFCDLGDLEHYLTHNEPTEKQKLQIMYDSATALDYIHNNKVVHRDLKLNNILLKRNGAEIVTKIADFGVSKIAHDSANLKNVRLKTKIGTLAFWAPELWARNQKEYTFKVDNFALGLIFLVVMEYDPHKHSHMKRLLPEDFVFRDSAEVQHYCYGQELNLAHEHKDPMPVLFELRSNEVFPKADIKLVIAKLTAFDPQSRMSLMQVVYDLGCLLGSYSSHSEQTRQQDQISKLNGDIQRLRMSIDDQKAEMRRLQEENVQLRQQLQHGASDKQPQTGGYNSKIQTETQRLGPVTVVRPKPTPRRSYGLIPTQSAKSQPRSSFAPPDLIKHIPGYIESLELVKVQLEETDHADEHCEKVAYNFGLIQMDLVCGLQNIYTAQHEIAQRFDDIPLKILSEMNEKISDILEVLTQTVHTRFGGAVSEFLEHRYYSLRSLLTEIKKRPVYVGFFCSYLKPSKLDQVKAAAATEPTPETDVAVLRDENRQLKSIRRQQETRIKKLDNDLLSAQRDCTNKTEEIRRLSERLKEQELSKIRLETDYFKRPKTTPKPGVMNPVSRSYSSAAKMTLNSFAKQKRRESSTALPKVNKECNSPPKEEDK